MCVGHVCEGDIIYTPGGYITIYVPTSKTPVVALRRSAFVASNASYDDYKTLQVAAVKSDKLGMNPGQDQHFETLANLCC